jgi:uncharacterized protein (TIGR03086 family)
MDPVSRCQRALDDALATIETVRPAELTAQTPCEQWNARTLINHMLGTCLTFLGGLRRAMPGAESETLDLGTVDSKGIFERGGIAMMTGEPIGIADEDLPDVYRRTSKALMAAWRAPGALENTLQMPFGEMPAAMAVQIVAADQLLHTWDLTKALGRPFTMDEDLASATLTMMQQFNNPAQRGPGKAFGHPVPCPENAPVQERLVALAGRQP